MGTVGLTGAPGVGKSTVTGALVGALRAAGAGRVAVLAVDPSSPFSGGASNCGFSGDDKDIFLQLTLARCRCGERPYGFEFLGIFSPDPMNREGILQIQPELLGGPEILGQASCHFGSNSPLLPDDVVHRRGRNMQFDRQPVS